jgi:hypothetical protein
MAVPIPTATRVSLLFLAMLVLRSEHISSYTIYRIGQISFALGTKAYRIIQPWASARIERSAGTIVFHFSPPRSIELGRAENVLYRVPD